MSTATNLKQLPVKTASTKWSACVASGFWLSHFRDGVHPSTDWKRPRGRPPTTWLTTSQAWSSRDCILKVLVLVLSPKVLISVLVLKLFGLGLGLGLETCQWGQINLKIYILILNGENVSCYQAGDEPQISFDGLYLGFVSTPRPHDSVQWVEIAQNPLYQTMHPLF